MPYGTMPPPDVVDLLLEQHSRARDLMRDVMRTTGEQRRTAFRRLVHLLSVHEAAEQEVVHPTTRRTAVAGHEIVTDRLEEERAAKELLARLDRLDPDEADFLPAFRAMREVVVTHSVAEQRYEFNNLRKDVGPAERLGMRLLVHAAEKVAPTRPHPGVQSATANLLLGPPAAVYDRARDAVRAFRERSGDGAS
jgi:hypothetical protein